MAFAYSTSTPATGISGSISATTLTVTAVTGTLYPGLILTGTGVAANTMIVSSTGATWGTGTYTVSVSQTVSPFTGGTGTLSTITQTGTNTSLAGLTGLTGVTTTTVANGLNIYDIGYSRLLVNGTLSIGGSAAPYEMLILGQQVTWGASGVNTYYAYLQVDGASAVLNVGTSITNNGITDGYQNYNLIFQRGTGNAVDMNAFGGQFGAFIVRNGGRFNWYSGTLNFWGGIEFVANSTVLIGQPGWKQKPVLDYTRTTSNTLYVYSNAMTMHGLILQGGSSGARVGGGLGPVSVPLLFSGFEPRFAGIGLAGGASLPSGTYTFADFAGNYGGVTDVSKRCVGTVVWNLPNSAKGTSNVVTNNPVGLPYSMVVNILQTLNTSGTPNSVVCIQNSNGNFYQATASGAGSATISSILVGTYPDSLTAYPAPAGQPATAYFGAGDTGTTYQWAYSQLPSNSPVTLRGVGGTSTVFASAADSGVTLSESAAIAKLASSFTVNTTTNTITVTADSSLDDLYDALKTWKCTATQTNLQYPTIATQPVTTSGSTLVTAMNIVVDNSIVLSSGTKFTTINTSGTFTNAGFLYANVIGNVTTTGVLSSGVVITGNVIQNDPIDLTGVTINGNLTFNTSSPFPLTINYTNCVVTGTLSNSGSTIITITKVNTTLGTLGANVYDQQFATISAPNLISGTRVRIYNNTDGIEIYNNVMSGAGFSQSFNYTSDKTVTLTATYTSGATAKLGLSATGIFTATGVTFLDSQSDDTVYNGYAIDGSTVTGFSADYAQDDVNLTMATNFTAANLYAWWIYNTTTEDGIRNFFGGITALDAANIENDASVVDLFLDNSTADFIYQTDSIRFFKSNGVYPARIVTTGGGGIQVNWNSNVYVGTANVPSSAQNATATIAAMNATPPDVNVAKMNGATVLGTGVSNDLWRG